MATVDQIRKAIDAAYEQRVELRKLRDNETLSGDATWNARMAETYLVNLVEALLEDFAAAAVAADRADRAAIHDLKSS